MCVLRLRARACHTYTRACAPQRIPTQVELGLITCKVVRPHATSSVCSTVRFKTQVCIYRVVVPSPPYSRLGKLERPSSRISRHLGGQVTQETSLRPRGPGPPSPPRLLNEQVLKRKLRRSLSRVISHQVDQDHRQGVENPLLLILSHLDYLWKVVLQVISRKGCWLKGGLDTDLFETIPLKPSFSNDYVAHASRCAATSEFK